MRRRLAELDGEIGNLASNLLAGMVSTTLATMLADANRSGTACNRNCARCPATRYASFRTRAVARFEQKVAGIRSALNEPSVRAEAAETVRSLIDRITIEIVDGEAGADVEACTASLIDFAQNAETPRRSLARGRSVMVVAGTRNRLKHTLAMARA